MAKMMKMSMKKTTTMKSAMKMKSSMKKMSSMKMGMKKMNEYFTKCLAAKASGATSFHYNGATYHKHTKGHLVFFSKKK